MTEDTVQPALERPRFRNDLVAQPLEEEGVRYVDVTDPSSGSTFRFYDVEYSIACAMDGERDIDNLQEWTRAELGIEASSDELQSVVNTLAELGYLENVDAQALAAVAPEGDAASTPVDVMPPEAVPQAVDNVPTEVVGERPAGAEDEPAAEPPPAGYTDETAREVAEAYDQVMEITAEPSARIEETEPEADQQAVPHPVGPIMDDAGTGSAADELPETHVDEAEPAGETVQATPPPPPAQAGQPSEAEDSFAGLLEDEERAASAEPVVPIARSAVKSPPPQHLDDEDPTQVPTTGVDDDDDDVSVDLSAHLALDKREVQEAVRSSRVHAVPTLPADVTMDDEQSEAERAIAAASASSPVDAPAARSGPPPIPAAATHERILDPELRSEPRTTTKPPEDLRVPPAVALPTRPQAPLMGASSSASASQSGARPRPARPIEPTRMPPPAKAPPKSSSSLGLIMMLLLAAAAFAAAYIFRDRIFGSDDYSGSTPSRSPTSTPPEGTAAPNAPATAPPATSPPPEAPKDSLPAATVRAAEPGASEPAAAKSASGGNVAWVAGDGAAVQAGAPVVKLFGFAKVEAKLAENVDRGRFYQGKLDDAKAKGDTAAVEAAQRKVDAKKKGVDDATKELAKYVVAAPSAGTVKLTVQKGSQVKPGDTVAEIGGGAQAPGVLRATFDAGDLAAKYKDGGNAIVAAKGAPDKQFAAVVEKVEGSKVHVKLVAAGTGTAAAGDEIVLLPPSE